MVDMAERFRHQIVALEVEMLDVGSNPTVHPTSMEQIIQGINLVINVTNNNGPFV